MQTLLTVLQVLLSIALISLILIQHGRGADVGAAFGSGASATVFGARGSASFLTRLTAILATLFFLTSMGLAYYAARSGDRPGLMDRVSEVPVTAVPKGPAAGETAESDLPNVPQGAESPAGTEGSAQ